MRRIRIEKTPRRRSDRDRYDVLPMDPRDADIVRAKQLARRTERPRVAEQS
ncbi:MAG TPA: hypothetical protein VF129_06035 [Actinomycetota bacterium]